MRFNATVSSSGAVACEFRLPLKHPKGYGGLLEFARRIKFIITLRAPNYFVAYVPMDYIYYKIQGTYATK